MRARQRSADVAGNENAALPATREFLRYVEQQAVQLRQRAGVGAMERLDPQLVADRLGLTIVTPSDIAAMTPEQRASVEAVTPKQWSGSGLPLPGNRLLVILNPRQTPERAAVTVMEEVAHIQFGHQPTKISTLSNGVTKRTFNPRHEQEAYWTAAAALLPSKALGKAMRRRQSVAELATAYGFSVELVEFRLKVWGLWPYYIAKVA